MAELSGATGVVRRTGGSVDFGKQSSLDLDKKGSRESDKDRDKKRGSISRILPFRSRQPSPRSSIDSSDGGWTATSEADSLSRRSSRTSFFSFGSTAKKTKSSSSDPRSSRGKQENFPAVSLGDVWERDRQTGEVKDHTDMLHSLAHENELPGSGQRRKIKESDEPSVPPTQVISKLSPRLWHRIFESLELGDLASLAFASKEFQPLLVSSSSSSPSASSPASATGVESWKILSDPGHYRSRMDFLFRLDSSLPNHLLCYTCGRYHRRTQVGKESLKQSNVSNPLFDCPYASSSDPTKKMSRERITFGRNLPFNFLQLATRADRHGPGYGITSESLGRRYRDRDEVGTWAHQTRWVVLDGRLNMRVVSTCFAPPGLPPAGQRHLLYSREDFVPFFSVCAHWRDGELMPSVKCALGHIPVPLQGSGLQRGVDEMKLRMNRPSSLVTLCPSCRPLRRCPECPTEYLIEVKIAEDPREKDPTKLFKHALVVTRWSDLGDGCAPWSPEWASCTGDLHGYNSFEAVGKRAISGVFESWFNPEQIPPQNMVSLNPNKEKLGEKGHTWY